MTEPAPADPPRRLGLHLLLFLLTCMTTTWVGVLNTHPEVRWSDLRAILTLVPDGLPYSLSIMGILLAHEMGHYVLARWHGVKATLPFFIPMPLPPLGTLGAVIRMEGTIQRRSGLVDIGASGPLAGLVVAIPVLAYGLHLSPVRALGGGYLEGNSLLYLLLKVLVKGAPFPTEGLDVILHPMAWAGWVGLLVTMINLMPVGQLDGGHVSFAYFGDRYARVSAWLHRGLPLLGVLASGYAILELRAKIPLPFAAALGWSAGFPWILWWGILHLLRRLSGGRYHPPVGTEELGRGRRWLCLGMIAIFVLIFIPIPMRVIL